MFLAFLRKSKDKILLVCVCVYIEWKLIHYPCSGEGFLMIESLSKQRLSVRFIHIHHRLTARDNQRLRYEICVVQECHMRSLTMFQNLSKATTKPEHTPLRPLKVLTWTLTLILSSTQRYSSPRGLPLHTENTRQAGRTAASAYYDKWYREFS